jgi:ketosteroid isomerase-like protein
MTDSASLRTISRYYDGCSTGDVDLMMETLHPDVVHYFLAPNLGSEPVAGNEHLARYWRKVTGMIQATWVVDHIVEQGDEAVIEWTMFWVPPSGETVATRGAEWFRFAADGRITEIRSYYQQRPETTELDAFPYPERGYSSLSDRSSSIHRPVLGKVAE